MGGDAAGGDAAGAGVAGGGAAGCAAGGDDVAGAGVVDWSCATAKSVTAAMAATIHMARTHDAERGIETTNFIWVAPDRDSETTP